MKWRKWNRFLHRDIGYFFFGMSIIYGISGIALNHIDDWDPSYSIRNEKARISPSEITSNLNREKAKKILDILQVSSRYKNHYFPSGNTLKIFVEGGSVTLNRFTGEGIIEIVSRRPVFYQVNFLHYNNPKFLWTWFADIYGGALVFMALTGLWMVQGKKGLSGRGKWYVVAGILIPVIFLLMYL
jgi:hypothetical protein